MALRYVDFNGVLLNLSFLKHCSSHFGLSTTGIFFLMLIAIVLHILDRQGDFVARTDFLWKAKLKSEQEEVETMRGINKVTFIFCHFPFFFFFTLNIKFEQQVAVCI